MKNKFLKQAFIWLVGISIGFILSTLAMFLENGFSIYGFTIKQKYIALAGMLFNSIATIYYAYRTWKDSLNINGGTY